MNNPILTSLVFALLLLGCSEAGPTEAPAALADADASLDEAPGKRGASGKVRAPGARLEAEVLESNSDFINHIYLVDPGPALFIGTDDATGTVTPLPSVRRGQELVFEIRVHDPSGVDLGYRWRTGPPSRNPDLKRHARVAYLPGGEAKVFFEDLPADAWGTADEPNFADAIFVVRPAGTP